MASKSITLRGPLKNFHLFGEDRKRRRYSMVNQAIHTASTWARLGLSLKWPNSSLCWSSGKVLRESAMVERTINSIDMMARI